MKFSHQSTSHKHRYLLPLLEMKSKHDFGICLDGVIFSDIQNDDTTTLNPLPITILTRLTATGLSRTGKRARVQAGGRARNKQQALQRTVVQACVLYRRPRLQ